MTPMKADGEITRIKVKPLEYKKHVVKGVCAAKNCTRKCKGKLCSSCRCRKYRLSDPVRYAFNNLRNRAKQRNIVFTITLDDFRMWCKKVQYIGFSGRSAESYTIDRRYEDIGYHVDNIQVLKLKDNVKKYFSYDYRTKTARVTTEVKNEIRCPNCDSFNTVATDSGHFCQDCSYSINDIF